MMFVSLLRTRKKVLCWHRMHKKKVCENQKINFSCTSLPLSSVAPQMLVFLIHSNARPPLTIIFGEYKFEVKNSLYMREILMLKKCC